MDQSLLPTGETNHMTCLLPGMCFTFWKEGFYEARHSDRDTERTDLSSSWFYYNLNATLSATPTRPIRDNASCIMMSENPTNRERSRHVDVRAKFTSSGSQLLLLLRQP